MLMQIKQLDVVMQLGYSFGPLFQQELINKS